MSLNILPSDNFEHPETPDCLLGLGACDNSEVVGLNPGQVELVVRRSA